MQLCANRLEMELGVAGDQGRFAEPRVWSPYGNCRLVSVGKVAERLFCVGQSIDVQQALVEDKVLETPILRIEPWRFLRGKARYSKRFLERRKRFERRRFQNDILSNRLIHQHPRWWSSSSAIWRHPHRSEHAAFPHSAPPEVCASQQATTGRGWVMLGVVRGKRSSNRT